MSTTVGVDLAKNCFQVAEADVQYRLIGRKRLTRIQFSRWMGTHPPCQVLMEACGTAHYWARVLKGYGHHVKLLPAQTRAGVRSAEQDGRCRRRGAYRSLAIRRDSFR